MSSSEAPSVNSGNKYSINSEQQWLQIESNNPNVFEMSVNSDAGFGKVSVSDNS